MSIDYREAQKAVTRYRSRLTRLTNTKLPLPDKNLHGIIELWGMMQIEFNANNWPLPDQWRNWERAAEDAQMELRRRQA